MKNLKLTKGLSRNEMRVINGGKVEAGGTCVYASSLLCGGSQSAPCWNGSSCDTCCLA
jgi:hypothetical protein